MHRIIKIGGSLLKRPDLAATMTDWLMKQSAAEQTSVIIGGGDIIDAMRRLDAIHRLDSAAMHWRCIRLLRASFEIASELFPEWRTVETQAGFHTYQQSRTTEGIYLVAVDAFFVPGAEPQLPESWETTSDAIAAHLCQRLSADELVLLKSCAIPPKAGFEALAELKIIDEAMLPLAARIPRLRIESLDAG